MCTYFFLFPVVSNEQPDCCGMGWLMHQQTDISFEPMPPSTVVKESSCEIIETKEDVNEDGEKQLNVTVNFTVHGFSKREPILSPPCHVGDHYWRINIEPTPGNSDLVLFSLQCDAKPPKWLYDAKADLYLLSFNSDPKLLLGKIDDRFYYKKKIRQFSGNKNWDELLERDRYIEKDTIILHLKITETIDGIEPWNSKKETGFVGLKNKGATGHALHSLLQWMYFIVPLRENVLKLSLDPSDKSMVGALQNVFIGLRQSNTFVKTDILTKSFDSKTLNPIAVKELLSDLLDNVNCSMKGTRFKDMVPNLFEGKIASKKFYHIQLNVEGKKNSKYRPLIRPTINKNRLARRKLKFWILFFLTVYDSFNDYIANETSGDNRCDAGEQGSQTSEEAVKFVEFPPVLCLNLMRSLVTDNAANADSFEIEEQINLDEYLESREKDPANYILYAVLAHSGHNYVVYINPYGDGDWYKFDDEIVSKCKISEAIKRNRGAIIDDLGSNEKHCSNTCMLVYIRESCGDLRSSKKRYLSVNSSFHSGRSHIVENVSLRKKCLIKSMKKRYSSFEM